MNGIIEPSALEIPEKDYNAILKNLENGYIITIERREGFVDDVMKPHIIIIEKRDNSKYDNMTTSHFSCIPIVIKEEDDRQ